MEKLLPDSHRDLFSATLNSPSAHNAQPWNIRQTADDGLYEIHYLQTDDLPLDHDSKDAYLTMGAFIETLALQAPNHGLKAAIEPKLEKSGDDLYIASVHLEHSDDPMVDHLSEWIALRHTNRNKYSKEELPKALEADLRALGNVLLNPIDLKAVVREASIKSWTDKRYVADLKNWFREDNSAEDGITPLPFNISKSDVIAMKFAFWKGGFKSRFMGSVYGSKEVSDFMSSSKIGVISSEDMSPKNMLDAGRRLLRSWVTIISQGYAYQPCSVAVDERSTVGKVADIAGVDNPLAVYRIGKPSSPAKARSNRRPLDKVID